MADKRFMDVTKELFVPQERRRQRRVLISTAVRVRNAAGADHEFSEPTTTVNLAPGGCLIETGSPWYRRGMKVRVTLPYSDTAEEAQIEQEGTVVRVVELSKGRRYSVAFALKSSEDAPGSAADHSAAQRGSDIALPLVLVLAEDSASRSMKSYLSAEGYDVVAFNKIDEARNLLNECTPALVIAEIEGEQMPGYELCAYCKQDPRLKSVPVMLITSSAYPSDYAKAHSAGAVVCMAKPYRRERLGHVVRLLAPPPNADQKMEPPRKADASRRAGGHAHKSKVPSVVTSR
jgi:CheY-like chemotaxis protein